MELAAIILSSVAFILSLGCLVVSVWNTIHIQAQRLSTHTVIPVTPDSTMAKIEEELGNIAKGAGADFNDLNRNLHANGLDVDDLV